MSTKILVKENENTQHTDNNILVLKSVVLNIHKRHLFFQHLKKICDIYKGTGNILLVGRT